MSGCIDHDASHVGRIPSEGVLNEVEEQETKSSSKAKKKPWERSQSALDIKERMGRKEAGTRVSEQSRVYWDLSQAASSSNEDLPESPAVGGRFKISLQTIHQHEEMCQSHSSCNHGDPTTPTNTLPGHSREEDRVTHFDVSSNFYPSHHSEIRIEHPNQTDLGITYNTTSSLAAAVGGALPRLREHVTSLKSPAQRAEALQGLHRLMTEAWGTPAIGRELAYQICDALREEGGLECLLGYMAPSVLPPEQQIDSAKVLEQTMTPRNREHVARGRGLELVVGVAVREKNNEEMTIITTGILASLLKHSEKTCLAVINYGGLGVLLWASRSFKDRRCALHCAQALGNLALYGGSKAHTTMVDQQAADWLFPLAFSTDDSTRYYALLAVAALSVNKELIGSVVRSGTLQLIEPFVTSHGPAKFAASEAEHVHGQSREWLVRLLPLLVACRRETRALAAFHMAMEAAVKKEQQQLQLLRDIGAVPTLTRVASRGCLDEPASSLAASALEVLGEPVPPALKPQVPLWCPEEVQMWLEQEGFEELCSDFAEHKVDGDMLLTLDNTTLSKDLQVTNTLDQQRFLRCLTTLRLAADYSCSDPSAICDWLARCGLGAEYKQYWYGMIRAGVTRANVSLLNERILKEDCGIKCALHVREMLQTLGRHLPSSRASLQGLHISTGSNNEDKTTDCFISYRRSSGSQLASLLKVHLQLRGFSCFLDIERLGTGKFDTDLVDNIRRSRAFLLVLTPGALDRCMGDEAVMDWVHKEVVSALEHDTTIVPVIDHMFEWPQSELLPEDMRVVCSFNGIKWIHDYQDACIDKIERFLRAPLERDRPTVFTMGGSESAASSPGGFRVSKF